MISNHRHTVWSTSESKVLKWVQNFLVFVWNEGFWGQGFYALWDHINMQVVNNEGSYINMKWLKNELNVLIQAYNEYWPKFEIDMEFFEAT